MEPMTLGSPSGSPAMNPNSYLPSFLMGEAEVPTNSRNNTLSPNKGGRNISFVNSPQDFNRSALGQTSLFSGQPQTPTHVLIKDIGNYNGTPVQNQSISGPPTQGLFDSLRNERNQVETPNRTMPSQSNFGTPNPPYNTFGLNQSYQQQPQQIPQYNDSFISNESFNAPRAVMSPLAPTAPPIMGNTAYMRQYPSTPQYTEFWITVYGFPAPATATILQHFSQCGTIVDKIYPPQNGNWVHLKYSSRLECDKALNYNEKILGNNIMIGVTHCKDKAVVENENSFENITSTINVRPLAQTAYKSAQSASAVITSPDVPQKSSGFMNKAMDIFFGW